MTYLPPWQDQAAASDKLPPGLGDLLAQHGWRLHALGLVRRGFAGWSRRWRAAYGNRGTGLVLEADRRRRLIGHQTLIRREHTLEWLSSLTEVDQAIRTGRAAGVAQDLNDLPEGFSSHTLLR